MKYSDSVLSFRPVKKSLRRLLAVVFAVIILCEAAVMAVVTEITHKSLSKEAVKTSESLLEYYSGQLENQIDFAQKDLRSLAEDSGLLSAAAYDTVEEQQYFRKMQMKASMQKILNLNSILDGVFLYRPGAEEEEIPYLAVSSAYTSYEQELRLKEQIETRDLSVVSGYWSFWDVDGKEYLLYLEKGIYGWYGIWIKGQSILQEFELLSPDSQSGLYLCAPDGTVLEQRSVLSFSGTFLQTENGSVSEIDSKKYIKVVTDINQEGYVLAALLPEDEILDEMGAIRPLLAAAVLVNLLLLVLCIFCAGRFVYEPLDSLIRHMEKMKEGNLKTELALGNQLEEFEAVYRTFNEMQKSILTLKMDNYERQLQEEKIRRQFLQSQIKSHFYLNCLNIIYMLAQGKQYELIQKMDLCMANYMRYLTRPAEQPVPLLQELEHVQNYMTIQTLRYHDRIVFSCEMENPDMEQYMIYPLMIQTFVENAMKYGMDPEKKDNRLAVKISGIPENPGLFSVSVEDNGPGFSEEMLRQLNAQADFPLHGLSGIGIRNVKARLRIFYQDKGTLYFSNGEERGARVELRLPVLGADR